MTSERATWEAIRAWYVAHGYTEAARCLTHIMAEWQGHDPADLLRQLNGRPVAARSGRRPPAGSRRQNRRLDHYYSTRH